MDTSFNTVEVRVARISKAHGVGSTVFGKRRQGLAVPLKGPLLLTVGGSQIKVPSARKSL